MWCHNPENMKNKDENQGCGVGVGSNFGASGVEVGKNFPT
jgi:hypothetical protein